jgi:UDP-GlcNAc:undecaprenyl-phosphate GlcNAc-1-phosphate transferase
MLHASFAFVITMSLILVFDPVARQFGFVDRPNACKIRVSTIPVTGGITMFLGILLSTVLFGIAAGPSGTLLIGLACFLAVGVVDDLLNLHPCTKLAGQIAAALVMIMLGQCLIGPGQLLGLKSVNMPLVDGLTTIVFIVGLANAFNMLDGIDGLVGGAVFIILACLAIMATVLRMADILSHIVLLLAAVSGFLVLNTRHPWRSTAAVYMGDAGSLMLGAAVASFMLELAAGRGDPMQPGKPPVMPALLWLVALPAFDTLILIARRLAAGRNPLRGDHNHIHHVLLQGGFSVAAASAILVGVCCAYGATGLLLWRMAVPNGITFAALVVPFAAHMCFVLRGWNPVGDLRTAPGRPGAVSPNPLIQPEAGLR